MIIVDNVDKIVYECYRNIPVVKIPKIYEFPSVYYPVSYLYYLLKIIDHESKPFDINTLFCYMEEFHDNITFVNLNLHLN